MFRAARPRTLRTPRIVVLALPVVVAVGVVPVTQADGATTGRAISSSAWFHDPLTVTQRAALVPVPDQPWSVRGPAAQTRALWKSHGGAIAVPASTAVGHQLQQGQAVTLSRRNLFHAGSAEPTMATRHRLVTLAASLDQVTAVTCEGYTDFGGAAARESRLAKRAVKVCSLLAAAQPGVDTTTRGFGRTVPVVVGGKPSQRAANRRVVVLATAGRTVTPPAGGANPVRTPQATAPDAPTLSSVTGGINAVTLGFTAPASDGGSPITGYEWSTDQSTWTPMTTAGSSPYTVQLSSLLAGTRTYYVRAVNAVGHGPASNGSPATATDPATIPGAPTLTSVIGSGLRATLAFAAPASDGGSPITGYQWSTDHNTWTPMTTTGSSPYTVQLTSLPVGTATYYVRAVNSVGHGAASSGVSGTVLEVPNAASVVGAPFCMGSLAMGIFYANVITDTAAITGVEVSLDDGDTWSSPSGAHLAGQVVPGTDQWQWSSLPGVGVCDGILRHLSVRFTSANGPGPSSTPLDLH